MAENQKAYLHGTIEFYQARTNTKMTIAVERLAVVAAATLSRWPLCRTRVH